jgi:hypothetical protein
MNINSQAIIAWGWKAGGAPSASALSLVDGVGAGTISNTGDLSAITQSVSQTSGFSISKYVGSASANSTNSLPHNLGAKPDWIMIKSLYDAAEWIVWHTGLSTGYNINLNDDAAQFANATNGYIDGATTDTTNISIKGGSNSASWVAGTTEEYVCYAWTAVDGVSAFGNYDGASSTVTISGLGFTPKFVMIRRYGGSGPWFMYDTFRGTLDGAWAESPYVKADTTTIEATTDGWHIEVGSGYFKWNDWGRSGVNKNGESYIYCAFA